MAKAKTFEDKLLEPSGAWLEEQSQIFDFGPSEVGKEAIRICGLKRKLKEILGREWAEINFGPPIPDPELELIPQLRELDRFTHRLKPRSLEHLKQLVGVPNEAILRSRKIDPCGCQPRPTRMHLIPSGKRIAFTKLEAEQREAVHDMATNLVYGYADPDAVKNEFAGVADYAMRRASELPTFAYKDLIVCDGESVHFNGWSTLFFHNVIIEGSGEIRLGSHTKLHAFHIERV
ncbi:MAG: hypothetical protein JHC95_16550 [Solirubrobacteraceae bacterium]|nr:hypothetical protein [Solirubrobacteraceae bacterium]